MGDEVTPESNAEEREKRQSVPKNEAGVGGGTAAPSKRQKRWVGVAFNSIS